MSILSDFFGGVISCYYCEREFDSLPALRAHLQWCKERGFSKRRGGFF